jgi:hypothetical protein
MVCCNSRGTELEGVAVKIDVVALRAMAAAGATAEVIIAAVEAQQTAAKREQARVRKQRQRERSRDVTQCHAFEVGQPQALERPATPTTPTAQDDVPGAHAVPRDTKNAPLSLQEQDSLNLESEEEKKEAVVRVRARGRNERGTRLPDDWMPSLDDLAFARTLLHPDVVAPGRHVSGTTGTRAGPQAVKKN